MTTRDYIESMDPDSRVRAEVWGIAKNMLTLLLLLPLAACFLFLWGQVLTRGALLRDIEKYFSKEESES